MKKENKKEALTKEIIKKEIKDICVNSIKSDVFLIILFLLLIVFSSLLYAYHSTVGCLIFCVALLLPLLLRIVFGFVFLIKILLLTQKEKFNITKEKLNNKQSAEKRTTPIRDKAFLIKPWVFPADPYWLFFPTGKYGIPIGMNYLWSSSYTMDQLGVFRSSNVGDEFFLVIISNRIILAYNSEFFEL